MPSRKCQHPRTKPHHKVVQPKNLPNFSTLCLTLRPPLRRPYLSLAPLSLASSRHPPRRWCGQPSAPPEPRLSHLGHLEASTQPHGWVGGPLRAWAGTQENHEAATKFAVTLRRGPEARRGLAVIFGARISAKVILGQALAFWPSGRAHGPSFFSY